MSAPAGFPLRELLAVLDLEPVEGDRFRGRSRDIGTPSVFGGQVLAQALVAAARTVEEGRAAHSLHGYFILPGDVRAPIEYRVDRLRDGRSFTTRAVTALQHGRAIFNMAASFQVPEPGLEHQAGMPPVPPPEGLPTELERLRVVAERIPEPQRALYTQEPPIEVRPVDAPDLFHPAPAPPRRQVWFRAAGRMPDDALVHQAVLAYASDWGLLGTALRPHGVALGTPGLQAATLDHALWFHRPARADEWLLFDSDSPAAAGGRGFTRGSVFTRGGVLVASTVQEGLVRLRGGAPKR